MLNEKKINFNVILVMKIPEKIEATAAMTNEITTPGPATVRATIPATKYIPVPTQDPTPRDVRSSVVRHFCKTKENSLLILNSDSLSLSFY